MKKDTSTLLKRFVSRTGMVEHDPHPYTFGTPEDPYGLKKKEADKEFTPEAAVATARSKTKTRPTRKLTRPQWRIPRNLQRRVEREGGTWEDERFDPILLTVMSGTSYNGRDSADLANRVRSF